MRRVALAVASACVAAVLTTAASCGGRGPIQPTPGGNNGGGNQQPPPNNPPTIDSITIQGTRAKEPANFADVSEAVAVTAKVHDDETAPDKLQYDWTAPVGTFNGTGAQVTWTAPAVLPGSVPGDVALTLKVTETYGSGGSQTFHHDVSSTATLSLHDSAKEVGDMARQFLLDFSDSNIRDVPSIMRNFSEATPSCAAGKKEEASEVAQNRIDYKITSSSVGNAAVTVKFGSLCPFRVKGGDACAQVPVDWKSTRLTPGGATAVGGTEHVAGTDQVTAIYVADQKKWGLCESDFDGHLALRSTFIR